MPNLTRALRGWGYTKPKPGYRPDLSHPLTTGLVANWVFNEGGGTVIRDCSGNNYTGTMSTAAQGTTWKAGMLNGPGVFFGGSNTSCQVDCGNVTNIGPTGALTLSAWITISTINSVPCIVGKGKNYSMLFSNNNGRTLRYWNGYTLNDPSDVIVPYNTLALATITVGEDTCTFYLNGRKTSSTTSPTTGRVGSTNSSNLFIGYYASGGSGNRWPGFIDDVRIYNRALSAAEVQQIYYEPFAHWQPPAPKIFIMSDLVEVRGTYSYAMH